MSHRAIDLCQEGENCSRAMLRAGAEKYNITVSQEMLDSCNAITSGFGVGCTCSAIVAGVMLIGILFSEEEARKKSLQFFSYSQEEFKSLDCCKIAGEENCNNLIGRLAEVLEEIIGID